MTRHLATCRSRAGQACERPHVVVIVRHMGHTTQHTTVAFINGRVAVMIGYFENARHITEAGARVDIRLVDPVEGPAHRAGAEGFAISPVGGGGGLWRADLLVVLEDGSPCFHFHPEFKCDDVGERFDTPELTENPRGWIEDQLRDLPTLLARAGAGEVVASLDLEDHRRALPQMMAAIDGALARVPVAAAAHRE